MKFALILPLLLLPLVVSASSTDASSEIYRCIDARGHTSFGDKPCPIELVRGNSKAHGVWHKMLPMVKEGLKVYSHLGPDYHAIRSCMSQSENYHKRLDEISEPLNKLSQKKHGNMFLALENLKECGTCRVSAPNYCEKASEHLLREINVLTAVQILPPL